MAVSDRATSLELEVKNYSPYGVTVGSYLNMCGRHVSSPPTANAQAACGVKIKRSQHIEIRIDKETRTRCTLATPEPKWAHPHDGMLQA